MKKKSSRRTFLKSTLALSAAGIAMPGLPVRNAENGTQEPQPKKRVLVPVHVVADDLKDPEKWLKVQAGKAVFELLSVRQLYSKLVDYAKAREKDPFPTPFIDAILAELRGGTTQERMREIEQRLLSLLEDNRWALYETCIRELINLIEQYHRRERRVPRPPREISDADDLKLAIKEDRWKWGLRPPGSPYVWDSACPWGDCPAN